MREFLNQPVTVSNLLTMYAGVVLGKISVSYLEYRRSKKEYMEWMADNMKQAGYRD